MTVRPPRAPVLLAAVWLAGVLVATSVSLLAVRLVAAQVGDPAVAPLTAAGPAATPAPTATAPPEPGAPGASAAPPPTSPAVPAVTRAFATAAGSLGVQCSGTTLRLLYATPAAGYSVDERSVTGSGGEVRFRSAETRVRLRVSCASGQPVLVEQRTDGDGDGDGDDDEDEERDD